MVRLVDSNDNAPEFQWEHWKVIVSENLKPRDPIAHLTAIDKDSGAFGTVSYQLKGFGSEKFNVDRDTGEITLADKCGDRQCLDAEEEVSYALAFEATDGGGRNAVLNLQVCPLFSFTFFIIHQ